MGDVNAPEDDTMASTLATYLADHRRIAIEDANAAARAAGLPPVVSAAHRDHALGALMVLLRRDFPDAYRAACDLIADHGRKMS